MPVDVKELKAAQRPLDERVFEFLASHSGKAFKANEIAAQLEGVSMNALLFADLFLRSKGQTLPMVEEYAKALKKLVDEGKVASTQHQGRPVYYVESE